MYLQKCCRETPKLPPRHYLTNGVSYRDALPQQAVREETAKGKGTQLAPECADILLQMIDEDIDYQMCEL